MFSENHPIQKQMFFSGADYDSNPYLVFSSEQPSGNYIDAHNMQQTSNDGDTGIAEKIKGEQVLYPNTNNTSGYKCIGSTFVNDYFVEFWAPTNPALERIVRVNGVIVLSSVNFNISVDFPLSIHKNESSYSEVFATDKNVPPFVFNVKDMVDSVNTQKYFTAFDFSLYQINIQSALDIPVFIGLENVGGGGGGPVGMYQYQLRYSSLSGDKTRLSHPTPMIPIIERLSSDSREYPWAKTRGAAPNPSSVTSLAPKLRFRVTNLYDYDFIEIVRTAYNQGAGIDFTPAKKIVYKRAVAPGEISVVDYVDFQESNSDVAFSESDEVKELAHIEKAGSIRYYDRRILVADVEVASKIATPTFLTINSKTGFPIITPINKEGHKDPWNTVYRKSEMRGEKAGFGVNFYDCVGNSGYVAKITGLENYQFPNRREAVNSDSFTYSLDGAPLAATVATRTADHTYEVFDLGNAVSKENKCDFKNIVEKGNVSGITGTKKKTEILNPTGGVIYDCDESDGEIENHGAKVSAIGGLVSTAYSPFRPTSQNDTDVTGHNYIVNNKVAKQNIFTAGVASEASDVENYNPVGFAPEYYSMGMLISGITDIPKWAKSFAVVRTPSAGRVLCQGVGYYSLKPAVFDLIGNKNLGGKETKKMWFYAPDIEHGIVSSDTVNDIIQNPANYQLQFVSPLGFFSEYYSAEDNLVEKQRDRCVDMISYIRMIRDKDTDPVINPGEASGFGGVGAGGFRYVDYEIFRNTGGNTNAFTSSASKGNRYFNISSIKRKTEGRGTYFEITTDEDFYLNTYAGSVSDTNFDNAGAKNWTEPIYIVNIVRTGANIKENEIQKYRPTSHYQKIESIIGKSNGQAGQVFKLVDERWEDCIPSPKTGQTGYNTDRFIYVKLTDGTVQKWLNVTYLTLQQRNNIVNAINFTGSWSGDVKGVYTHTNVDGRDRFFEINFDVSGAAVATIPPTGSIIIVKYDNTAPIRVYGGDTYIGEAIFSPIDREAAASDEAEKQFAFGNALPYKTFKINPRYYTIRKAGATVNEVQDQPWFTLGYIRQLCVMFTCESRACLPYAYEGGYPNQFFPATNYVIRPNRWTVGNNLADNHIFEQYGSDYPSDQDNWKWGGFRFKQQVNPDYAVQGPYIFFSKPEFGFVEKLKYPNRAMWTLQRAINVENAPSLKTFPANNAYDTYDGCGALKYIWTDITDRGENVYALAESGVVVLLAKKTTLSDINSNTVGYMSVDRFIGDELWLSYSVGVPGKTWRSVCEGYVPMTGQDGSEIQKQAVFFLNNDSVYRIMNDTVVDIGRIKYHSRLKGYLKNITDNSHITSVFDNYKKQTYFHINNDENPITFVWNQKAGRWTGTNSFAGDRFASQDLDTYLSRDLKTYELNVGFQINGQNIEGWIMSCYAAGGTVDKEFIRFNANSYTKPTLVEFFKQKDGVVQCSLSAAQLKDYVGYECLIGRINASVNPDRPRLQENLIFTKIYHNLAEDFRLVDVDIMYKIIRK